MIVLDVISAALLSLGCFVALTSAVGLYRLPDFFSRIHAAGKTDTLAQQLIVLALLIEAATMSEWHAALKLILISALLFITSPASTHAIARAAYQEGLKPWTRPPEEQPADVEEPGPESAP